MNPENTAKDTKPKAIDFELYDHGQLMKTYPCGCKQWEDGSRGYCSKHWREEYFAGIETPENKRRNRDLTEKIS